MRFYERIDAMYGSYLKLMQGKIQTLSELMSDTLGLDVTVVDSSLRRIAGTGNFYLHIDQDSPHNSIFKGVLDSKEPSRNLNKEDNPICIGCTKYDDCQEKENITYPIIVNESSIGVVSVASFSEDQSTILEQHEKEATALIEYFVNVIGEEVVNIEKQNKIIESSVDVNEVINSVDKGIIIIDSNQLIVHINNSASSYLNLNFSTEKVIGSSLKSVVSGLKHNINENVEIYSNWNVKGVNYRVVYKINFILMNKKAIYKIITFETIEEIVHKATIYKGRQKVTFSKIIGKSVPITNAIEIAKVTALSDSNILLNGESGTGKELFARSIHNESFRKEGPFVAINCACLPETLVESELFGYAKGAFTGADVQGRVGKFEHANGGTIFLDEISEFPLNLQSKLLRVLQERQIERVGSNELIDLDVRIIAATNKDLCELVEQNKFRKDLFYRLNVIPINLPTLKERGGDILLLAEYLLKIISERMDKGEVALDNKVLSVLTNYSWPGNVRELENAIEYALNFCFTNKIEVKHLPPYINEKIEVATELKDSLTTYERTLILNYLSKYGDSTKSKQKIAKELGISLSTLYRKLQTL